MKEPLIPVENEEHETLRESVGEAIEDIEDVLEGAWTYDETRHGKKTPLSKTLLLTRNIAAALAAILFIVATTAHISTLSAIAYFLGAAAYLSELLIMTGCFKRQVSHDELFMAVVFGPLYLLMGIGYMVR